MNALIIQFIRPHVIDTNAVVDTKLIRWIQQMWPMRSIIPLTVVVAVAAAATNRITHCPRREFQFRSTTQWIIYFCRTMAKEMLMLCTAATTPTPESVPPTPKQNSKQTMNCTKTVRTLILMKLMIFVNDTQTNALAHWIAQSEKYNCRNSWDRCHRRRHQ